MRLGHLERMARAIQMLLRRHRVRSMNAPHRRQRAVRNFPQGVRVAYTEIGLGVVALKQFQPNVSIGQIEGPLVWGANYGSNYAISFDRRRSLEPRPPFRYLNHSCEPNSEIVDYQVIGDGPPHRELWIESIALIEEGDELCIDYAWPKDVAIPCRCGSPQCRGWIVDAEDPGDRKMMSTEVIKRVPVAPDETT